MDNFELLSKLYQYESSVLSYMDVRKHDVNNLMTIINFYKNLAENNNLDEIRVQKLFSVFNKVEIFLKEVS